MTGSWQGANRQSHRWVHSCSNTPNAILAQHPRQAHRRWGNSLGVCLTAAIARGAEQREVQTVAFKVVVDGVLILPVQPCLSLADRLAAHAPMSNELTKAMAWELPVSR